MLLYAIGEMSSMSPRLSGVSEAGTAREVEFIAWQSGKDRVRFVADISIIALANQLVLVQLTGAVNCE